MFDYHISITRMGVVARQIIQRSVILDDDIRVASFPDHLWNTARNRLDSRWLKVLIIPLYRLILMFYLFARHKKSLIEISIVHPGFVAD